MTPKRKCWIVQYACMWMCMGFTVPWEEQGAVKPPGHGEQSGPKKPLQQRGAWSRQIMANLTGSD